MKFLIMTSILTFSFTIKAEVFRISGQNYTFEGKDYLIHGCVGKCDARKAVESHKKIDLTKVRAKLKFVASVGSDVCQHVYKAGSVIGLNADRDQRAFCVFPDKSMIELNSLSEYLIQKKIVK